MSTWTQTLGDWIGTHTRALAAIGGVPRLIVPDNAKVAVIKACLYEPQVNRSYAEMAAHYTTAVPPTRPLNALNSLVPFTLQCRVENALLVRGTARNQ